MDKPLCRSVTERLDTIIQDLNDLRSSCDIKVESTDRNDLDGIIEIACSMQARLYNMAEGTMLETAIFAKTIGKQQ